MFSQKGQAFDVFKLLIAAVVAVVILTLLLSIINQIGVFGQSDPPSKAGTLIRDLSTKKGTYDTTEAVVFSNGKSLTNISIAEATRGNVQPEEVCILGGDFDTANSWRIVEGVSVQYKGSSPQRATIVGICDTGSRMADADYFETYTGGEIDSAWIGDCDCVDSENQSTCCIVAVKKAR